jgi:membrane fusion protein (multidrug efflux system)
MSWIIAGVYCWFLWLVFAKFRLLRLSLPVAILAASVGPGLIMVLLFCAQFYHPFTSQARVFQKVVPVTPQLQQPGRVIEIAVKANVPIKQGDVLFRVDPQPYVNSVNRLTAVVAEAKQGKNVAEASIELSNASIARATAELDFATADRNRNEKLVESNSVSKEDYELSITRYSEAQAALNQANASLRQSRSSVELSVAKIDQATLQLADAKYDLEQTTVHAPSDGYVTNLQLQKGMLVGGAGGGAVMSFIVDKSEENQGVVVAAFSQKNYLRIKTGQYAEVALHNYPGEILTGRVLDTIDISGAGQLTASGDIPDDLGSSKEATFAVRIKLDNSEKLRIPAGTQAQVAIYTEHVQIAGIPIMFLIRAQSWLRYLM